MPLEGERYGTAPVSEIRKKVATHTHRDTTVSPMADCTDEGEGGRGTSSDTHGPPDYSERESTLDETIAAARTLSISRVMITRGFLSGCCEILLLLCTSLRESRRVDLTFKRALLCPRANKHCTAVLAAVAALLVPSVRRTLSTTALVGY